FSGLPGNVRGVPSANPTIVEHSQPIPEDAFGQYVVRFEWTAPGANTGNVTLYAIINAVNNDNSSGGDIPSVTMSVPLVDTTSVGKVSREVVIKASPNPVQDVLTVDMSNADAGEYYYRFVNSLGAIVTEGIYYVGSGNYTHAISSA